MKAASKTGFLTATAIAITMAALAPATCGDTLVLRSGDVLSGKLVNIRNGILAFRTTLSGQIMVPTEEIDSLATDEVISLSLANAETHKGRFVVSDGRTRLVQGRGNVSRPLDLAAVTDAYPLDEGELETTSPTPRVESKDKKLKAAWETGAYWHWGNADYSDLFARLTLHCDSDYGSFLATVLVERADTDRFPRWLWFDTEWMRKGETLQPYAALEIERNTDTALHLRGSLTAGVGKPVYESPDGKRRLFASGGLGVSFEHYDRQALPGTRILGSVEPLPGKADHEKHELHGRLRLRYAQRLLKNSSFSEDIWLYPSLSNPGDLRARSESTFLLPMAARLKLKLNLLVDYDSEPPYDRLDNWRTSVGASILWDF